MNPKISIIVPVYKVEQYLGKCIDSILTQSYTDFELILVDDGSPDYCGKICDQYAKEDNRIIVLHQENRGLSGARNAGLDIAKGEYVGFVDSDDFIHEKMYEILYNYAIFHEADITVCDFLRVSENENCDTKYFLNKMNSKQFTNIEGLYQLFHQKEGGMTGAGNNITWVIACNKLYKRSLFKNNKFNEGRICEDEFIIHKLLYTSKNITFVPYGLYFYVRRNGSIIQSSYSIKRFDKVYALKERAEFFQKIKEKSLYNKAARSYIEVFFWNYFKAKRELTDISPELKKLKRTLNKVFFKLMVNPLLGWKQKLAILGFIVHPFLFEIVFYIKRFN